MAKNKGGRPTVMTPEMVSKLESAFSYGLTDEEACLSAGITKPTLYEYIKKNPEFSDRKEALKKSPSITAKRNVVDAMNEGDKETAKWYLERKNKDEFSTKQNTQVSGDPNQPLVVGWASEQDSNTVHAEGGTEEPT